VIEVLAMLEAGSLVHASQSDARLLPTSPSEQDNGRAVVEIIFGDETPDTTGGKQSFTAIEAAANAASDLRRSIGEAAQHQGSVTGSATGNE
jgi:phage protein U